MYFSNLIFFLFFSFDEFGFHTDSNANCNNFPPIETSQNRYEILIYYSEFQKISANEGCMIIIGVKCVFLLNIRGKKEMKMDINKAIKTMNISNGKKHKQK